MENELESSKAGSVTRAAIYVRSCKQDYFGSNVSIEKQRSSLESFCKKRNWVIYKTYIDNGYSGNNLDRPELKKMLQECKQKQFNTVLIYSPDRFSRSLSNFLFIMDKLKKHNISIGTFMKPVATKKALDLWNGPGMYKLLKKLMENISREVINELKEI